MPVGVAAVTSSLSVSVPHASVYLRSEQHRRLSVPLSASSSSQAASLIASRSQLSSVDTQSTQDTDSSRPQTLAECQEFIHRLEADSVKQAQEVSIPAAVYQPIATVMQ